MYDFQTSDSQRNEIIKRQPKRLFEKYKADYFRGLTVFNLRSIRDLPLVATRLSFTTTTIYSIWGIL